MQGEVLGRTLKWVALLTMLVDHSCAVVLSAYALRQGDGRLLEISQALRLTVGRIAFPLYCFLLVEGFVHSRNRLHYGCRLLGFALLAEPAFDLALRGRWWSTDYQNVLWTLLLALMGMALMERAADWGREAGAWPGKALASLAGVAGPALLVYLAQAVHTDYGGFGVAVIFVLYAFREKKWLAILSASLVFGLMGRAEWTAPLAFILVYFYRGRKGGGAIGAGCLPSWVGQYAFYAFYPLHLLGLSLLASAMGLRPWP